MTAIKKGEESGQRLGTKTDENRSDENVRRLTCWKKNKTLLV